MLKYNKLVVYDMLYRRVRKIAPYGNNNKSRHNFSCIIVHLVRFKDKCSSGDNYFVNSCRNCGRHAGYKDYANIYFRNGKQL